MKEHDWVRVVLEDIAKYAIKNQLPELSNFVMSLLDIVFNEIEELNHLAQDSENI